MQTYVQAHISRQLNRVYNACSIAAVQFACFFFNSLHFFPLILFCIQTAESKSMPNRRLKKIDTAMTL